MRTRHKTPTIFNLSMVDVLCCALGCVILLWLINQRYAQQRAAAAGNTEQMLTIAKADLDRLRRTEDDLNRRLGAALARATLLSSQLDDAHRSQDVAVT